LNLGIRDNNLIDESQLIYMLYHVISVV